MPLWTDFDTGTLFLISSLTEFPLDFISSSLLLRILSAVRLVKPRNLGSRKVLSNLSELWLLSEKLLLLLLFLRGDLVIRRDLVLFFLSELLCRYLSGLLLLLPWYLDAYLSQLGLLLLRIGLRLLPLAQSLLGLLLTGLLLLCLGRLSGREDLNFLWS